MLHHLVVSWNCHCHLDGTIAIGLVWNSHTVVVVVVVSRIAVRAHGPYQYVYYDFRILQDIPSRDTGMGSLLDDSCHGPDDGADYLDRAVVVASVSYFEYYHNNTYVFGCEPCVWG